MKNWKLSYFINAALFISMMALAGIGLLMKYVLIAGRDAMVKYGSKIDLYFLGLDRHQWAKIHFIISLVLIGLLALHIYLHWKMIVQLFKKLVPSRPARKALLYSFLFVSIILAGFPLFVKPELLEAEPQRRFASEGRAALSPRRQILQEQPPPVAASEPAPGQSATAPAEAAETPSQPGETQAATEEVEEEGHIRTLDIQGYMTLREIAQRYDVPEEHILRKLGISERGAVRERLGQLRRRYDFRMSTIEEIITEYRLKNPPPPQFLY